jgi:hypothetical protein
VGRVWWPTWPKFYGCAQKQVDILATNLNVGEEKLVHVHRGHVSVELNVTPTLPHKQSNES